MNPKSLFKRFIQSNTRTSDRENNFIDLKILIEKRTGQKLSPLELQVIYNFDDVQLEVVKGWMEVAV